MDQQPPIEDIKHHYAGVFLVTDTGKVIGQHRDDKPTIDNPGSIGLFGGAVEEGEDPSEAAFRELGEETNLKVRKEDIHHLMDRVAWRKFTGEWEVKHFYYAFIKEVDLKTLEVYEGQGWEYINDSDPRLSKSLYGMTKILFDKINIL